MDWGKMAQRTGQFVLDTADKLKKAVPSETATQIVKHGDDVAEEAGGATGKILDLGDVDLITDTLDTANIPRHHVKQELTDEGKDKILQHAEAGEEAAERIVPEGDPFMDIQRAHAENKSAKGLGEKASDLQTEREAMEAASGNSKETVIPPAPPPEPKISHTEKYRVPDVYDPSGYYRHEGGDPLVFPDYIASEIERAHNLFNNRNEKSKLWGLHDEVHGIYKSHMLFKRIPYHIRNFTDNYFWRGMFLGRNTNSDNYSMSKNILDMSKDTAAQKAAKDPEIGLIAGRLPSELHTTMTQLRVFSPEMIKDHWGATNNLENIHRLKTWGRESAKKVFGDPAGDSISDVTGFMAKQIARPGAFVRDTGAKFQQATEDWFRGSMFIDRIRKGDTDKEALRFVNKIFFDYGDLSNLEKKLGKRAFSWYTFHAKNTPLQFGMKFEDPLKFGPYMHAVVNLNRSADEKVDSRYMAEYAKGGMPLFIRETPDGDAEFFLLGSWISDVRFNNVSPNDWTHLAVNQLNPFIKKAGEHLLNYDSFRRKPIEKYKGETERGVLGVPVPKSGLLGMTLDYYTDISMFSQLNRLNPYSIFGKAPTAEYKKGKLEVTDRGLKPLESIGISHPTADSAIGRRYDTGPNKRFLYFFVGGSLYTYDRVRGERYEYNKFNSKYFPGHDIVRDWFQAAKNVPNTQYGSVKFKQSVAEKVGDRGMYRETTEALKLMDIK